MPSLQPLSTSVVKLPRGSDVPPVSFSFSPLPFTALKGRGAVPMFKVTIQRTFSFQVDPRVLLEKLNV